MSPLLAESSAEWHRKFALFTDLLRSCPVAGHCAHCEWLVTDMIVWLRGSDDRTARQAATPTVVPPCR